MYLLIVFLYRADEVDYILFGQHANDESSQSIQEDDFQEDAILSTSFFAELLPMEEVKAKVWKLHLTSEQNFELKMIFLLKSCRNFV